MSTKNLLSYYRYMQYRRAKSPGSSYFFTVVTHNRRSILCKPENIEFLRDSFRRVRQQHPFIIDAIVILPNHIHCIWTLPKGDADFSTRWRLIKSWFSRQCHLQYQGKVSASRHSKGEKAVWQRRFWEHLIRDEQDFILRAGRPPIYWGMRASARLTNSTKLSSYTKDFICCKIAPTLNHSCVHLVGLFVPRKTTVM